MRISTSMPVHAIAYVQCMCAQVDATVMLLWLGKLQQKLERHVHCWAGLKFRACTRRHGWDLKGSDGRLRSKAGSNAVRGGATKYLFTRLPAVGPSAAQVWYDLGLR